MKKILNLIRPYYFDEAQHKFRRMGGWFLLIITLIGAATFFTAWVISARVELKTISNFEEEQKIVIIKNGDKFSEKKLALFLKELHVKYPEIIYAQAKLESGNFKSELVKTNNNYFGMKISGNRPTTRSAEENGYAYYDNWRMSVIDYVFYSWCNLKDLKTREDYYDALTQMKYSETSDYIERVKTNEKEYFKILEKIQEGTKSIELR